MARPAKLTIDDGKLLRTHPLFAEVPDDMFDRIVTSSRSLRLKKNDIVFHAGDPAVSFYLIAKGVIRLFRSDADGAEATVNLFRAGQSFGDAAMFLERAYPVTSQVVESAHLIRINAKIIFEGIREEPRLAFGMLASMSMHLKAFVDEITLLRIPTARLRLAEFLLRQAPISSGTAEISLPYSKVNIAKRLGVSPEVLSRAFASLRSHGVVVERGNVEIKDVSLLRDLLER